MFYTIIITFGLRGSRLLEVNQMSCLNDMTSSFTVIRQVSGTEASAMWTHPVFNTNWLI